MTSSTRPDAIILAEIEHVRPLDDTPHEVEIVLDEEHGRATAGPHLDQDLRETDRLARVETRGRLVQQQQPAGPAQGHGRARRGARGPGSGTRSGRPATSSRPSSTRSSSTRAHRAFALPPPDQVLPEPAVGPVHPLGDHQVLTRAHPGEQLEPLEGAPYPEAGTLEHGQPVDAAALEADLPRVEVAYTVQAVEQRRLPGPVRAHETHRLAVVDRDGDVVQGDDTAVTLGNRRWPPGAPCQPTVSACLRKDTTTSTTRRFCHSTTPSGCSA